MWIKSEKYENFVEEIKTLNREKDELIAILSELIIQKHNGKIAINYPQLNGRRKLSWHEEADNGSMIIMSKAYGFKERDFDKKE